VEYLTDDPERYARGDLGQASKLAVEMNPARESVMGARGETAARNRALDGLRGIAIILVVFGHYAGVLAPGRVGVPLFFILSGFLITSLLQRELSSRGTIDLPRFYLRRLLRIGPAFLLYLGLVAFLVGPHGGGLRPGEFLSAATYTSNYYQALHGWARSPVEHTWTLAIEEQFYLLWPALLLWSGRGSERRLVLCLTATICLTLVLRLVLSRLHVGSVVYIGRAFETRCDLLAAGCLLAMLWGSRAHRVVSRILARGQWTPFLSILLLVVIFLRPRSQVWLYTALIVVLGALFLQMLHLARTPCWRWIEAKPLRWIGRISYSLYLFHLLPFQALASLGWAPLQRAAISLVLALLFATASYYGVESPILRWRDRFVVPSVRGGAHEGAVQPGISR
jgi:peptidoglycan/LPS O-acetylase OafA/YrhL